MLSVLRGERPSVAVSSSGRRDREILIGWSTDNIQKEGIGWRGGSLRNWKSELELLTVTQPDVFGWDHQEDSSHCFSES